LLLLVLSLICFIQLRARPYLAVGWLWYLGTMLTVIGIIQVGEQAMADRYTYLPLIGPTIAIIWFFADAFSARTASTSQLLAALVPLIITLLLLVACCVFTSLQLQYWRDTVTLFTHAANATKNNSSAEFFIALGLEGQGQPDKATAHYEAALAINPYEAQAHYNLAQMLRKSGHWRNRACWWRD
jgi:tetratricopeptide (TPR) repeat protein